MEEVQATAICPDVFAWSRDVQRTSIDFIFFTLKELNIRRRPNGFFEGKGGSAVISPYVG